MAKVWKTIELGDDQVIEVEVDENAPPGEIFKVAAQLVSMGDKRQKKQSVMDKVVREPGDTFHSYMGRLQNQYGDESTINRDVATSGFLPHVRDTYDEAELLKRRAQAEWGGSAGTPGPFATVGRMGDDIYQGARQFLPEDFFGHSPKEIENLKNEDLIWQASDRTLSNEAAALGITMAPSLATMPLLYTGLGKAVGSQTIRGVGERAAARQAGMKSFPKTSAALGAAYGGLQKHDYDATPGEAVYTRLINAAIGAGTNYAMTHALNTLPDAIRTQQFENLKGKLQKDLPKKVREHPFDVYGSSQAKTKFNEYVKATGGTGDRATSAQTTVVNDLRDSTHKVLEDMVGTSNPQPVGSAMNKIMDKYFEVYKVSKKIMDDAYKAIPDDATIKVTNKVAFRDWGKALQKEIENKNLSTDGPVKEILREFNKLGRGHKNQSLRFTNIRNFMHKLNKAQQRIYNNENMKDLRPAITKIKSDVTDYIGNGDWRYKGQRGGTPGSLDPTIQAWKHANDVASKHYDKFHGIDVLDEAIDTFNKNGKSGIVPTDIAEDIFVGSVSKLDKRTGPRVGIINKFRGALGDQPDFNVERALKQEAINTLWSGGTKGKDMIDDLLNNIDEHVITGIHSEMFDPKGYGGKPGLFNAKENAQLRQLVGVKNRFDDQHIGMKSGTRDVTQIPNSLGGRLLQDTLLNKYGPFGFQWAGKTGELLSKLAPEGVREMNKQRLDDRVIRRMTAGLMGNYGPQVPAPMVGPMVSNLSNEPTGGQLANEDYEKMKLLFEYMNK